MASSLAEKYGSAPGPIATGTLADKYGVPEEIESPGVMSRIGDAVTLQSRIGTGVVENLMHLGTSFYAKPRSEIAGMAAMGMDAATGMEGDPRQFAEDTRENMTYQPRGEMGKAITESPFHPMNILSKGIGWAGDKLANIGDPDAAGDTPMGMLANAIRETTHQGIALGLMKLGSKKTLETKQQKLDIKKQKEHLSNLAREEAKSHGFITPAETGIKQAVSDVAKSNQVISVANRETASRIIGEELGVPKGSLLSPEILEGISQKHYAAYDAVVEASKQKPTLQPPQTTASPILDVRGNPVEIVRPPVFKDPGIKATSDYTTTLNNWIKEIDKKLDPKTGAPVTNASLKEGRALLKEWAGKEYLAPELIMDSIKKLRADARALYNKIDSPKSLESASIRMEIANQLEGLFESHLTKTGQADLMAQFKDARKGLSQINAVNKALNPVTGLVDIGILSRMSKSKKTKFTGALKVVADFGWAFPTGAKSIKGTPVRIGMFDTIVAGTSLVAGHPGWAVAEITGRQWIPVAAKYGALQNKTPSYTPNIKTRGGAGGMGMATPAAIEEFNRRARNE